LEFHLNVNFFDYGPKNVEKGGSGEDVFMLLITTINFDVSTSQSFPGYTPNNLGSCEDVVA